MKPPIQHTSTVGTVNNLRAGKSENLSSIPGWGGFIFLRHSVSTGFGYWSYIRSV
jgi:hypothetical protein